MEHNNGTSTHMGAREGVGPFQHPGNERSMNHTWENREHDEHEDLHMNGGGMSRQAKRPMSYNGDMGRKAKKMKKYKQMCEKALDRMSALFGQSVEPHEMTKALLLAVKNGSPEEVVSAIEIFSDYRWAVNEKKELAEELNDEEDED
jgi:vacuolar-type H+-ATPase subunit C/Vma6